MFMFHYNSIQLWPWKFETVTHTVTSNLLSGAGLASQVTGTRGVVFYIIHIVKCLRHHQTWEEPMRQEFSREP